ncbi:MAG: hypothetical protein Q9190_003651 [Brigantiaea leucoxantha]
MSPKPSKPIVGHSRSTFKSPGPASSSKANNTEAKRKSAPHRIPSFSSTSSEDSPAAAAAAAAMHNSGSSGEDFPSVAVAPPAPSQDSPPTIPPKLLTRLLHYHSEKHAKENLKINKEANALVGKYIEIFVREAIARAAHEKSQAADEGGSGDDFLEVEDLEKLAPQLLLDF